MSVWNAHGGSGGGAPAGSPANRIPDLVSGVLGGIADPVCVKDTAGRYIYANDGCARLLGVPVEQAIGHTNAELGARPESERTGGIEEAVMRDGRARLVEWTHVTNGERRAYESRISVWTAPDGAVLGTVEIARDITAQRATEAALGESEARFRMLADTAPAHLAKLTTELEATVAELHRRTREAEMARERAERTEKNLRFLDEASRVLQGSLDTRATLQSVTDLAVPRMADRCTVHLFDDMLVRIDSHADEDLRPVVEELTRHYPTWSRIGPVRVVRTGAPEIYPEVDEEMLRTAAHDEEHLKLLKRSRIRSALVVPMKVGPRVLGTITLQNVDSSRRFSEQDLPLAEELARRAAMAVDNAQLYRKAEDASRAKSEFLATMSHELRTPLNAISGYTDLLQLGFSDPRDRREHLDRIKANTWHLLSMIEEILTFSRLEDGTAYLQRDPVDVESLAREAIDLLDPAARQKGLAVRLDLPAEPIEVETDRLKARQILMNLLSNAVKFTDRGEISLSVRREPPWAVFDVADTGVGIRPEQLRRIFEPFWQAEMGRTRRSGGTGIGLAVAWRLAELLGGRLEVDSTYGGGSTFSLRLPLG